MDRSPRAKRREIMWDGGCYRISALNQIVHRHYRIMFDRLSVRGKK